MSFFNNVNRVSAEYMKPILEDIDSVRLVPVEEIKANTNKYPRGNEYSSQRYLIVEPPEDGKLDLSEFYKKLPDSLSDKLASLPYKQPDRDDPLVIITVRTDVIDDEEECVELDTPSLDRFEKLLAVIADDLSYIYPEQSGPLLEVVEATPDRARIRVTKKIINDSRYHGKLEPNIHQYINQQYLRCSKFVADTGDYYELEVKPPVEGKMQEGRDRFLVCVLQTTTLRCNECQSNSVILGTTSHLSHCTNCGKKFYQLQIRDFPLYTTATEFVTNKWTDYTENTQADQNVQRFDIGEMTGLDASNTKMRLDTFHTFNGGITLLYMKEETHDLWIPFDPRTKEINADNNITNGDSVCFYCSNRLGEGTHSEVARVGIPQDEQIAIDKAHFCSDCVGKIEGKLQQVLEENPELNAEIVSANI